MKVIVVQNKLTDSQKLELGVNPRVNFEWQVTPNREYLVISVRNILNSDFYGSSVLFEIEDDYGRLLSVPACLFKISDPTPSKYWQVKIDGHLFSMEDKDFIDDSSLSERILDREPNAISKFEEIKERMAKEN